MSSFRCIKCERFCNTCILAKGAWSAISNCKISDKFTTFVTLQHNRYSTISSTWAIGLSLLPKPFFAAKLGLSEHLLVFLIRLCWPQHIKTLYQRLCQQLDFWSLKNLRQTLANQSPKQTKRSLSLEGMYQLQKPAFLASLHWELLFAKNS